KGGNLLLNVGPTGEGLIPPESVSRLREMGAWMRTNGDAIYGTTASPYGRPTWGRYTAKRGRVFAHIFDWPKDGKLAVTGVKESLARAYLLADNKPLPIERGANGVVIRLPS